MKARLIIICIATQASLDCPYPYAHLVLIATSFLYFDTFVKKDKVFDDTNCYKIVKSYLKIWRVKCPLSVCLKSKAWRNSNAFFPDLSSRNEIINHFENLL